MGNAFPFEVGLFRLAYAKADNTLIKIENQNIPSFINFYVEEEAIHDLNDPCIIDYAHGKATAVNMEMLFIPVIAKPLEDYDFYDPSLPNN